MKLFSVLADIDKMEWTPYKHPDGTAMYSSSVDELNFVIVQIAENKQNRWVAMCRENVFDHHITESLEEANAWVTLRCRTGAVPLP